MSQPTSPVYTTQPFLYITCITRLFRVVADNSLWYSLLHSRTEQRSCIVFDTSNKGGNNSQVHSQVNRLLNIINLSAELVRLRTTIYYMVQ